MLSLSENMNGLAVNFEMDGDPELSINIDKFRSHSVLRSLIQNAIDSIKSSDREGNITIRYIEHHKHAEIDVIDDGPEFLASYRSNLFMVFLAGEDSSAMDCTTVRMMPQPWEVAST